MVAESCPLSSRRLVGIVAFREAGQFRFTQRVQAGQTAQATVWLDEAAPAGGFEVELWTDDTASVPTRVVIPAGATHAEFSVSTSKVKDNKQINVAALSPQSSAHTGLMILPNHQVVLNK